MQRIKNLIASLRGRLPSLPAGRMRVALIAGIVVFGLITMGGIATVVLNYSGDTADNYSPVTVIETTTPENDDGVDEATPPPAPVPVSPPTKVAEQIPPPAPAPVVPSVPTPPPAPNDGSAPRVVTKVRPTDISVVGSSTPGRTRYEFRDGYLIITSDVEELNVEADGAEGAEQDTVVTGRMGQPQEVRIEGSAPATLRYRAGEGLTVETDGRNLSIH